MLARAVRMTLFAAVLLALAGAWLLHRAHARVSEPLLELGRRMETYADPAADRAPDAGREIWLNGERAFVAATRTGAGVEAVLDHLEARCRRGGVDMESELDALSRDAGLEEPAGGLAVLDGVLRAEREGAGFVVCIDGFREADLGARMRAFDRSGDLAALGELRYAFARPAGEGGALVVSVWTRGAFRIGRMFPERGDAPGRDVDGVPRPEGARRVLSVWEGERPYRFAIYGAEDATVEGAARDVGRELARAGWNVTPRTASPPERVLHATRAGRSVLVVITADPELGVATTVLEPG